jgi:hypothetical protein
MARIEQSLSDRGSQKWLQLAVNLKPSVLDDLILPKLAGAARLSWCSPLYADGYAEYRDADFLQKIGADNLAPQLAAFWPERGPQWDALACSDQSDIILVEAKAHLGELCSPATKAGPGSREKIREALDQCALYIGAEPRAPWTDVFYQLANRIAHLCFLRKHGVRAWLVLINFVGDSERHGPTTEREWSAAYQIVWHVLGITKENPIRSLIIDICPKVESLGVQSTETFVTPSTIDSMAMFEDAPIVPVKQA